MGVVVLKLLCALGNHLLSFVAGDNIFSIFFKVLISGKEELDAPVSPAMNAAIRIFKRVSGIGEGDDKGSAADVAAFCSIRLLVPSAQALTLIGKQGSTIKSIQESSGAGVRILPEGLCTLFC